MCKKETSESNPSNNKALEASGRKPVQLKPEELIEGLTRLRDNLHQLLTPAEAEFLAEQELAEEFGIDGVLPVGDIGGENQTKDEKLIIDTKFLPDKK